MPFVIGGVIALLLVAGGLAIYHLGRLREREIQAQARERERRG
jgi:hypothetical protein